MFAWRRFNTPWCLKRNYSWKICYYLKRSEILGWKTNGWKMWYHCKICSSIKTTVDKCPGCLSGFIRSTSSKCPVFSEMDRVWCDRQGVANSSKVGRLGWGHRLWRWFSGFLTFFCRWMNGMIDECSRKVIQAEVWIGLRRSLLARRSMGKL